MLQLWGKNSMEEQNWSEATSIETFRNASDALPSSRLLSRENFHNRRNPPRGDQVCHIRNGALVFRFEHVCFFHCTITNKTSYCRRLSDTLPCRLSLLPLCYAVQREARNFFRLENKRRRPYAFPFDYFFFFFFFFCFSKDNVLSLYLTNNKYS